MGQQLAGLPDSFPDMLGCLRQSSDTDKKSRGRLSLQACDRDSTLADVPWTHYIA